MRLVRSSRGYLKAHHLNERREKDHWAQRLPATTILNEEEAIPIGSQGAATTLNSKRNQEAQVRLQPRLMQSDTLGPVLVASVRLIVGLKWPNFDLEPVSWRREDISGRVLGKQQFVELLEVPSPNGVPCVIHACAFASPGEIEYLKRAVHFYKAATNAPKADPILVTLAVDPEDAYTALASGIELYHTIQRIDKNVAMVMAGGPVPRLNGKLWDSVNVEDICKPSGSRIIFPLQTPPVPPPKTMDAPASPFPSRYDYAPLPSPVQAGARGADIPKVPSDRIPPTRDRGTDDSPGSPASAAAGSPLSGSNSGSRRGEMLSRSVSHSPSIAVKPRVSEGGSAVARTPDSLRREALNKSPMKAAREDLPQSLSGTSPSRIGPSSLSAYDSDGGSGGRRDSENDSDDEGGIKSDKLEKASPSDRRRHVVLEILHTERDYVKDLELLLDSFHRPISKLNLLNANELNAIFSNTSELLGINKEFLQLLEARKEAAGADVNLVCLGAAFKKSVEPFKRYSRYFTDYVFAYTTVQQAIEQNENFAAFLEENQANPRLRGLKLDQFLIKPVQRICKYPLLLRELLKATPADHVDYAELQEASTEIEALVAQLNEKKRTTETQQKVLELMTLVEGLDKNPNFPRNTSRTFIMEGELKLLMKKTQKFRVVLFSDALFWLMLREKAGKDGRKQEYTGMAPINATSRMVDIADNEDAKNVFSLQYADGNVSFVCASAPEKRRWVREVRAQVNEQLKKDMKQKALGDSGGRTSTPLRLTGSLRSSTVDISQRRDSSAPEPVRAATSRGEPERKGSFMGLASEPPLERRGSGGSTSMKAPMGLVRKDRGTD